MLKKLLLLVGTAEAAIRGINFYGLETPRKDFVCSWQHPPSFYVDKLSELGFNALRIPISVEYVREGSYYRLDDMFQAVSKHADMNIVLDMHRIFSGHQAYEPQESYINLDMFIDAWKTVLHRYKDNPQLVAVDIFNEVQHQDADRWNGMARKIVTELEKEFPGRFVYYVGGTNWGGNIAKMNLEDLPFSDRIRYTIHKYHFSGPDENDWNYSFGPFIDKVNVGEWGFKSEVYQEKEWAMRFVKYLKGRGITDNYFWTIAMSGDTGGLWYDDCENIDWEKFNIVKSLWTEKEGRSLRGEMCTPVGQAGWYYDPCLP